MSMDRVLDAASTAGAGLGEFPGLRYGELVERRALRQPQRTAIIYDGEHITYGQLLTRIRAAAAFLAARGVGAGDRVVCFAENRPEVLIALYACSRIGAVFTPLGISSRAGEVQHVLEDLSAHTLLVSTRSVAAARCPALSRASAWTGATAGRGDWPRGWPTGSATRFCTTVCATAAAG